MATVIRPGRAPATIKSHAISLAPVKSEPLEPAIDRIRAVLRLSKGSSDLAVLGEAAARLEKVAW